MDRGGASHPIVELTLARVREFLREPEAVFWVFAFPVLMAFALGIAFRNRGEERVPVGVVRGDGAAAVEADLQNAGGFVVRTLDPEAVEPALTRGDVQLVIVPGRPPTFRFDPTRTESRLARLTANDALQRAAGSHPSTENYCKHRSRSTPTSDGP